MSETVEETLQAREKLYGDYSVTTPLRVEILSILHRLYRHTHNGLQMPLGLTVTLCDIILKLSRAALAPDHADNWRDLAGYALLALRRYNGHMQWTRIQGDWRCPVICKVPLCGRIIGYSTIEGVNVICPEHASVEDKG